MSVEKHGTGLVLKGSDLMNCFEYKIGVGTKQMRYWFKASNRATAERICRETAGSRKKIEFVAMHPIKHMQEVGLNIAMPPPDYKYMHDEKCRRDWEDGNRCRHSKRIE